MFKKLLLTGLLLGGCLSTDAQLYRTFSSYPRATTLGDSDLLLTSFYSAGSYTTNKAISFTNFVTQLSGIFGGSSVYVNGANVDAPNFATGTNVIVAVSATTNIYFFPTNIVNAQIEASAAIARSKIANGTADHIVINSGAGALSSEATLGATRFPALTGDVTTPGGSLATTIANSGVTAGVYGNGAYIPQITVDAKGRLTSVTTNAVTGTAPTGTMVSNGSTFIAGTVPVATDTTGTNFTGTSTITVTTTNTSFKGTVFVDNLVATNGITLGSGGTNLNVDGILSAHGGAFTNTLTLNGVNVVAGTNQNQQKVWAAVGATNLGVFDRITLWPGSNVTMTSTNGAGNTNVDISISASGSGGGVYSVQGGATTSNPGDSPFVYHVGWGYSIALSQTQGIRRIPISRAGTISDYVVVVHMTTIGSNENVTVDLLLNGTTSVGSHSEQWDATTKVTSTTGLSQAVSVGDYIELRITSPTWGTNPLGVTLYFQVNINL